MPNNLVTTPKNFPGPRVPWPGSRPPTLLVDLSGEILAVTRNTVSVKVTQTFDRRARVVGVQAIRLAAGNNHQIRTNPVSFATDTESVSTVFEFDDTPTDKASYIVTIDYKWQFGEYDKANNVLTAEWLSSWVLPDLEAYAFALDPSTSGRFKWQGVIRNIGGASTPEGTNVSVGMSVTDPNGISYGTIAGSYSETIGSLSPGTEHVTATLCDTPTLTGRWHVAFQVNLNPPTLIEFTMENNFFDIESDLVAPVGVLEALRRRDD